MLSRTMMIALFGLLVGPADAQLQEKVSSEELSQVVETAVSFVLRTSPQSAKRDAREMVLDTTSSFGSLRAAAIANEVRLVRALNVGRALPMVARGSVISCPTQTISPTCTFTRSVTSVWVGKTSRLSADQMSVLVHVMYPSNSEAFKNGIDGFTMEVIVKKDQAGRWSGARRGIVAAG